MASAPKCKLCGSAHWSSQPHLFVGRPAKIDISEISDPTSFAPKPQRRTGLAYAGPALPAVAAGAPITPEIVATLQRLHEKRQQAAAYMREYRKTHPRKT